MELYPDFLNTRRTGKWWVLKFRQTPCFPRRVFPDTVQSVLRWWSFASALSVIRIDRQFWPNVLSVVCSTKEFCCSTKMIYRSILARVPRLDCSTIFFCPHWSLLRQSQVGPGIITQRTDCIAISYLVFTSGSNILVWRFITNSIRELAPYFIRIFWLQFILLFG